MPFWRNVRQIAILAIEAQRFVGEAAIDERCGEWRVRRSLEFSPVSWVSSLSGYEVGSALSVLPNVTQNRSCLEEGGSPRIYVIVRDGTPSHLSGVGLANDA